MDLKFVNEKVIKNLVRARKIKLPTKELDIAEDLKWNAKKINSELLQSIQAGESIPKLAKRLQTVTDMNKKAAIRNARTMCTSAQNVGRVNSMKDLIKQGINVKKQWISTLDSRTRDTHLALNGKIVDVNQSFKSGLKYPADPNGEAGEVYNCRCTLGYVIDDNKYEGNTQYSLGEDVSNDVNAMKQKQLEIINKNNPMLDDYHTGVRSVSDIRTAKEAFDTMVDENEDYAYPDFTKGDGIKALKSGKITVYSSQPIKQGVFISPSKMMAKDYAGSGKVYSETISIHDVAWINSGEGQYAKIKKG